MSLITNSQLSLCLFQILVGIFILVNISGCGREASLLPVAAERPASEAPHIGPAESGSQLVDFEPGAANDRANLALHDTQLSPSLDPATHSSQLANSQTRVTDHYENGTTHRTFAAGVAEPALRHGPYLERYPNGQVFCEGNFRHGVPDGDWIYRHDNGQVAKKGTYEVGFATSRWEWFREDGTLARFVEYAHGMRHGLEAEFAADGKTCLRETHFANDQRHGSCIVRNEDGVKVHEIAYQNGLRDGPETRWHANGQKSMAGTYRRGKPIRPFSYWDVNGESLRAVGWVEGGESQGDVPGPRNQDRRTEGTDNAD
jgi:antitoxin component YwqK of YwqJK toxin-antitoxin module